jgi:hypothetical protein
VRLRRGIAGGTGGNGFVLAAPLDASPEREIVVRKTPAPAPKADRSGTKIAAMIEKAKTTGITMAQVREMTG